MYSFNLSARKYTRQPVFPNSLQKSEAVSTNICNRSLDSGDSLEKN